MCRYAHLNLFSPRLSLGVSWKLALGDEWVSVISCPRYRPHVNACRSGMFRIDLCRVVKRQPQSIPWICRHSIEVVAAITERARVGVRLVGLHSPMCPLFHVDHATSRPVCHLRGPDERVARGA
jgi:hypothetical protein